MKIAFVDNLFHKKTGSSEFFAETLKTHNEVIYIWHNSWLNDKFLNIDEINDNSYDLIIFWQVIAKPYQIKKLKCKNIIWIPMYDTEILKPLYSLQTNGYVNIGIRIISFSKSLTKKLDNLGFNILTLQYYNKPQNIIKNFNTKDILFWQRIELINFKLIKKIIEKNTIDNFIYKNNPDLDQKAIIPNNNEIKNCNINIVSGWMNKEDYYKLLDKCNIFIAPRKYEGIGMSFLDAMAYGLVVISPNYPTANEYIRDGYNGYLYDINNPKPIDLSNIEEIASNMRKSYVIGYNNWQEQQKNILEFIKPDNFKISTKNKIFYSIYCLYSPILEVLRKIKRLLKIKFY